MALTREERKLLHQKAKNPTFGNGKPDDKDGSNGDVSYRKIQGSGTVQYIKESGRWKAISSSGEMPKVQIIGSSGKSSSSTSSSGGVTAHSLLTGLDVDDHTQYLRTDGTRALGGAWDMGGQTLTNVSIDADNSTITNLAHGGEVDNPTSGVHGVTGDVVGTSDTQTLTNKTLTSPDINTPDIDGGTVDGTTIGATTAANGTFTAIVGTSLDVSDGDITNVRGVYCDSILVDDATVGLDIGFGGNTGLNKVSLTDNLANALDITESSNSYIKFVTTNSSEKIVFGKASYFSETGGDETNPNVKIDGFAKLDGNVQINGTLDVNNNVDIDSPGAFQVDAGATSHIETTNGDIRLNASSVLDLNGGTVDIDSTGALSIDSGGDSNLSTSSGSMTVSNAVSSLVFDSDTTIDSGGDIILDADGSQVYMKDGGSTKYTFNMGANPELDVSGSFTIDSSSSITMDSVGNFNVVVDGNNLIKASSATGQLYFNGYSQTLYQDYAVNDMADKYHRTSGLADFRQNHSILSDDFPPTSYEAYPS